MAMSNLYSKIAPKPPKRLTPDMNTQNTVSQTNQWINGMIVKHNMHTDILAPV